MLKTHQEILRIGWFKRVCLIFMVTGSNSHHPEDGERNPPATAASRGGGGATRSWGTTVSGQSVSTSGSVGSPSQGMGTPASDNTFLRLNHLDIHGDDAGSQGAVGLVIDLF